jgi:hypothetical protein
MKLSFFEPVTLKRKGFNVKVARSKPKSVFVKILDALPVVFFTSIAVILAIIILFFFDAKTDPGKSILLLCCSAVAIGIAAFIATKQRQRNGDYDPRDVRFKLLPDTRKNR